MKLFICHSGDFDYFSKLYEPLRASLALREHELYLPHEDGRNVKTKDVIATADVVIAEVSLPSTGQGIELGWADAGNVPIIAVYETGSDYSKSAGYIAKLMSEYKNTEEMLQIITDFVSEQGLLKSQ